MVKVPKNTFKKFLLGFLIFLLAMAWVFGYPPLYEDFWRVKIWQEPPIPPKIQEARAENLSLYVDGFDASENNWTNVGASPYLTAQDQPTNYIYSNGRNKNSGNYSFANTSTIGIINSVYLYIYAYGVATNDFEAVLSGVGTGLGPPAGSWQWVSVDVSSILTTWDAINAATVLFDRPNTDNEAGVDAAYLYVDYTPPAAEVSCSVSATSTGFGLVPDDAVSTSTPNIDVSMSCSYTASGCTLSVQGTGSGASPGLWNSVASYLVTSTDVTLSAGTEGYGIQATSSDGDWTLSSKYVVTGSQVGGLTIAITTLASSTADITTSTATITHKAARSSGTPTGSYQDTIIYSCTVN